jgi:hypothetical protein
MSGDSSPPALTICPECGVTGRKVGLVTLQALLTEDARERLADSESYRFCKSQACEVVYFGELEPTTFHRPDVRVPVFQKSTDSSRLVCYCFEHRVKDIEDDVRRMGASSIPDAIGQQCKAGLDHCEDTNPQGSCCLGNVRQVMKQAHARKPKCAPGEACAVPNPKLATVGASFHLVSSTAPGGVRGPHATIRQHENLEAVSLDHIEDAPPALHVAELRPSWCGEKQLEIGEGPLDATPPAQCEGRVLLANERGVEQAGPPIRRFLDELDTN